MSVARTFRWVFHAALVPIALAGCASRMVVATGTTIGLHATPGDMQSQPPQVTLAYKRAETAVVPTEGARAVKGERDSLSSFVSFGFFTEWFGETRVDSLISTGIAAQTLADSPEIVDIK